MSNSVPPSTRNRVALTPDLRDLSERGVRAWTERMAVRPLRGTPAYVVESESDRTYVVDPLAGTCTCPDHEIRGETCKHLRRVAIEITARRVPPPGKRWADCVVCGARTTAPDDSQPPLCPACRLVPGDVVLDRETDDRLVVVNVTTDRADEVEIASMETTLAEYPTNEGYPSDDLVVEVVYVSEILRRDDPTRYSFPHSRLEPADDAEIVL